MYPETSQRQIQEIGNKGLRNSVTQLVSRTYGRCCRRADPFLQMRQTVFMASTSKQAQNLYLPRTWALSPAPQNSTKAIMSIVALRTLHFRWCVVCSTNKYKREQDISKLLANCYKITSTRTSRGPIFTFTPISSASISILSYKPHGGAPPEVYCDANHHHCTVFPWLHRTASYDEFGTSENLLI